MGGQTLQKNQISFMDGSLRNYGIKRHVLIYDTLYEKKKSAKLSPANVSCFPHLTENGQKRVKKTLKRF